MTKNYRFLIDSFLLFSILKLFNLYILLLKNIYFFNKSIYLRLKHIQNGDIFYENTLI